MANFIKTPTSKLDFAVDWSDWLSSGETIASSTWTSPDNLVIETTSYADTQTIIWVSGGAINKVYRLVNTITTSNTPVRTDQRTLTIKVQDR